MKAPTAMKKISVFFLLSLAIIACKPIDNTETDPNETTQKVKDTTMVGADQDENGCLASAGYTWSKVNKECVKIFTGIQLNPAKDQANEDMVLCAYVLFNEDGDQAEVFLPNEESVVLTKTAEDKTWSYKDYVLVGQNGYVLKNGTEELYKGDGIIGSKVTGSDQEEGQ